jgi:carbon-monoxide dehydrogenase medium subunit
MKPSSFEYYAPETVDEAVALLGELGDDAKALAGGQSLVPLLSLRLAYYDHLVDVGRIAELRGIDADADADADAIVIGATTVAAAVERDARIATKTPLLARATPFVGHFQIRNRGTVGGSIAHADPAAEYPAVALTLDAEMEAVSPRGVRRIPATAFFRGFWTTDLEPDELLARTRFPVWTGRCGFAVREFARRHGDFALAGAMVAVKLDADDRIARAAITLLGLGPTPLRATGAERAALGQKADIAADELGAAAVADLTDIPSDIHGSAAYRRRVGAAMVRRAWEQAIDEAMRG